MTIDQCHVDVGAILLVDHIVIGNYLFSLLFTGDFEHAFVQFVGSCVYCIAYQSCLDEIHFCHFLALIIYYSVETAGIIKFTRHQPFCKMVQEKFVILDFFGKEASEVIENITEEVIAHHLDFDSFRNREEFFI